MSINQLSKEKSQFVSVLHIAIPTALQTLLQTALLSIADQIMVSRLGTYSVAGVGLVGRYTSIFSTILTSIATLASIMIAQHYGKRDEKGVNQAISVNMSTSLALSLVFMVTSILFAPQILQLYSQDQQTIAEASVYLRVLAWEFIPMSITNVISALLRCKGKSQIPLYFGLIGVGSNILLNWLLIFGVGPFPAMGIRGAGLATVLSLTVTSLLLLIYHVTFVIHHESYVVYDINIHTRGWINYLRMFFPLICSGFSFTLCLNVFAGIYAHIGTLESASLAIQTPLNITCTSLFTGFSVAATVLVGKNLGVQNLNQAYSLSKRFILYSVAGSLIFSVFAFFFRGLYLNLFYLDTDLKAMSERIVICYTIIAPLQILNMVLSGSILRSGGKTVYTMLNDLVCDWGIGVPVVLLSAFVFHLPFHLVYLMTIVNEAAKTLVAFLVFKKRVWMHTIESD